MSIESMQPTLNAQQGLNALRRAVERVLREDAARAAVDQLKERFAILMESACDRAKSECGYDANEFLEMLGQIGAVEAATAILRAPTDSKLFVALAERRRLDLSVEAQILSNPIYWRLFDEPDLDVARLRLYEHGYDVQTQTARP